MLTFSKFFVFSTFQRTGSTRGTFCVVGRIILPPSSSWKIQKYLRVHVQLLLFAHLHTFWNELIFFASVVLNLVGGPFGRNSLEVVPRSGNVVDVDVAGKIVTEVVGSCEDDIFLFIVILPVNGEVPPVILLASTSS